MSNNAKIDETIRNEDGTFDYVVSRGTKRIRMFGYKFFMFNLIGTDEEDADFDQRAFNRTFNTCYKAAKANKGERVFDENDEHEVMFIA